jgi:hypothetical protein
MTIFPGLDASGNGNDWTENNINNTDSTVTTYDIMTDVPTLTDEDTANYAVLNPLSSGANYDLEDGNLTFRGNSVTHSSSLPTILPSSGKYYFEFTLDNWAADGGWGVSTNPNGVAAYPSGAGYWWWYTNPTRTIFDDEGSAVYTSGSTLTPTGAVGQMAIDFDTNKVYIGINNTFYDADGSADGSPSTDVRPTFNIGGSAQIYPFFETGGSYVNINVGLNFGQRPFAYTPPTGYLKLNTFNLPDSSIVDGSENFNTVTYTGQTVSSNFIDNGDGTWSQTGLNFQPDLVWIKQRSGTAYHNVYDILRIDSGDHKRLYTNATNAEESSTYLGTTNLTSFDSGGFSVGSGSDTNNSGSTYVAWNWKANGTGVSNTDGTITSSVSANTTAGFSVVTWTGTGAVATIGHSLGVAPGFIIVKQRDAVRGWVTYNKNLASNQVIYLNVTGAANTDTTAFNATAPTSSVFSVGTSADTNQSSGTYVAYCFAEVEGYSKIGSYTGNGSTDGPFIYTGFKPAWIMLRDSTNVQNWIVLDTARNTYNAPASYLLPNSSGAEGTLDPGVDVLSNGFKMRTANSGWNTSSAVMIYMAFAENPFKNSLAR